MRFVVYFILFGFLFVSCSGNQSEQTSGEESSTELSAGTDSDTSFILPDEIKEETLEKTADIAEVPDDELQGQQDVKPGFGAKEGKEKNRDNVEFHYKRGLVLYKINNYEEGVREFDTAIALDPNKGESYLNRGKGLMQLQRYNEACKDFEHAVNSNYRDTTSYLQLAMAYYKLGRYQDAVEANTEVIILAPRKAKGYYNRGIAYGLLKEYEKGIADFNQAIAINPKYAEAFFNRGLAYYFMGDKKTACEDWELAKFYGNQKAIGAIDNYCK